MPSVDGPIRSREALDDALERLLVLDPALAGAREEVRSAGPIPLRYRPPGFAGLAEIIIGQQVSKSAASAIHARLTSLIDPLQAERVLQVGLPVLVEAGLSRAKQASLLDVADAVVHRGLDLAEVARLPASKARQTLSALRGVGPWTADVFLLFSAGHRDIFPAGDVALQHATGWVLNRPEKPGTVQTASLAERWAGERAAAARLLYALYAARKRRTALPV